MSELLNKLAKNRIESKYTNPTVRSELEKLSYMIRRNAGGRIRNVNANLAKTYTGDFYGLLQEIGIEAKFHWITMRVNNLKCSMDYDGKTTAILVPNFNLIEKTVNSIRV